MQKRPFMAKIRLFVLFFTVVFSASAAAANPFPQYEIIKPNVAFWTKIYSAYTTRQAVVHDSRDLNIIYDIIELRPQKAPGARKANRKRMKKAKARYQRILEKLASNPTSGNSECRRVASLFGSKNNAATFSGAARRVRCQIGQKDRFAAGLIRSGAYIEEIRSIFESYGLPADLAYLPHVESSFNINAYSKFGAAGMWQFTRSTGKRFMQVGYVLDERRDPIRATHAAARLLMDNYNKLQNWPLAITAYNHGATGMLKAKSAHGDYPAIVRAYRGRTFKFASRNFYSEFLAAVQIASDYPSYFGNIMLDRPRRSRTIELAAYADLDDICAHFQVSRSTIKSLNPALRDPVYHGQKYVPKGYALRLPAAAATGSLPGEMPLYAYKKKQKPSLFYTVQRGDTAGKIARIHGVRLSDLALANNLNHRATIYPKQTLRIPQNGQMPPAPLPAIAASRDMVHGQDTITAGRAHVPAPPSVEIYPAPVMASVIPVSMPSRLTDNAESDAAGQKDIPSIEVVTADVGFKEFTTQQGLKTGLIQVEVEETLGHYADWADVQTQNIRILNKLRFGTTLRLHQKLRIPLVKVSASDFEEQRYEFHKRLQEDFFAIYQVSKTEPYRIRRGDSFWTLCRQKFDIPMWLLSNCNPEVDFADLRIHHKLLIPSVELKADGAITPSGDEASSPEPSETGTSPSLPLAQMRSPARSSR